MYNCDNFDYAAHGVREYWIIDPNRQTLEQFIRPGEDTEFMPANKFCRPTRRCKAGPSKVSKFG